MIKITNEKLRDANQFIGFNIKEGVYSLEQFEGWTDSQLIEFYEKEEGRADAYANEGEKEYNDHL